MSIELDKGDKRALWLQIVDQVIDYITKGKLLPLAIRSFQLDN